MDSGLTLALSFLIGGVFLMTVLNTQTNLQKTATINYLEEEVHQRLDGLRDIIKTDIEKAGYNIDLDAIPHSMVLKDTNGTGFNNYIKFYLDVKSTHEDDADNDLDSIMIWSSDTTAMGHTENPDDRYIYRQVNDGNPLTIGSGVTFFKVEARDRSDIVDGDDLIVIEMKVSTPFSYEDQYFTSFWKGYICPKNLRKQ
ncbi:MAG TPA: hypothetical protein VKP78_11275 [bacterium]|nr:hypothetical protein [bacterium]